MNDISELERSIGIVDDSKDFLEELGDELGTFCNFCGNDKNIHRHHVVRRSHIFGDDRKASDKIGDNLVALCAECHMALHFGNSDKAKKLRSLYNMSREFYEKNKRFVEGI